VPQLSPGLPPQLGLGLGLLAQVLATTVVAFTSVPSCLEERQIECTKWHPASLAFRQDTGCHCPLTAARAFSAIFVAEGHSAAVS